MAMLHHNSAIPSLFQSSHRSPRQHEAKVREILASQFQPFPLPKLALLEEKCDSKASKAPVSESQEIQLVETQVPSNWDEFGKVEGILDLSQFRWEGCFICENSKCLC